MNISFGATPANSPILKNKDIKNQNESDLKTGNIKKTEQNSKDSLELNSSTPDKKDTVVEKKQTKADFDNTDDGKKDELSKNKIKNQDADSNTKTLKEKLVVFKNKMLPKKDEQISAKTLLGMSALASGVAVVTGLFNRSLFRTVGLVAAFFTPYLLTKGVEMINVQTPAKKG